MCLYHMSECKYYVCATLIQMLWSLLIDILDCVIISEESPETTSGDSKKNIVLAYIEIAVP